MWGRIPRPVSVQSADSLPERRSPGEVGHAPDLMAGQVRDGAEKKRPRISGSSSIHCLVWTSEGHESLMHGFDRFAP